MNESNTDQEPRDLTQLQAALNHVGSRQYDRAYFVPLLSKANPMDAFRDDASVFRTQRGELDVLEWLPSLREEESTDDRPIPTEAQGRLYVGSALPHVWFAVTFDNTLFVRRVERKIASERSFFPPFDLTMKEMFALLSHVCSAFGFDGLTSTHSVLRSRSGRASIDHKPQPFEQIFRWADERQDTISRLRVTSKGSPKIEFMIFRGGRVRIHHAGGLPLYETLIQPILDLVRGRVATTTNRARRSFDQLGKPLEIRYPTELFRCLEDNLPVVAALQRVGHGSLVVHHANPYFHATFLDMIDGGYVDLFITSDNSISLVPGFGASEGVLLRMIDAIFDTHPDGQIVSQPTLPRLGIEEIMGGP